MNRTQVIQSDNHQEQVEWFDFYAGFYHDPLRSLNVKVVQ